VTVRSASNHPPLAGFEWCEPLSAFDLSGRSAAITGVASGIGALAAEFLATAGPLWCPAMSKRDSRPSPIGLVAVTPEIGVDDVDFAGFPMVTPRDAVAG
jgi:hypothetical protein